MEFFFLGIWRLWRVFLTQNKNPLYESYWINFLIISFCRQVAETRPILFYFKNDDINAVVRDAPHPLFPRI